jgi:hypothetical protein
VNFVVYVPVSGERLEDREQLAEQLSRAAVRKGHKAGAPEDVDRIVVLLDGQEQDEVFRPANTFTGLLEGCGQSDLVDEPWLFMVMPTATGTYEWGIVWRSERETIFTGAKTFGEVRHAFNDFLQKMGRPGMPLGEVSAAMESVATMWGLYSDDLDLDAEEQKVGDALADSMGQLATVEHPPKAVVREIAGWFKKRLDLYADEFAKAAGKTTGHIAGVGISAGLAAGAAHIDLGTAVEHLWRLVQ